MLITKCKFCGGNLTIAESQKNSTCEFCGTKQYFSLISDLDSIKIANLVKRLYNYLEDRDYNTLEKYFNKVLDIDPENYEAYKIKVFSNIVNQFDNRELPSNLYIETDLKTNTDYQKMIKNVLKFSIQDFNRELNSFVTNIQIKASSLETQNIEDYIIDVEDEAFGEYLIDVYRTEIQNLERMLSVINSEHSNKLKEGLTIKLKTCEKELLDSKNTPKFLLGTYTYRGDTSGLKATIATPHLTIGTIQYNYGFFNNETSYRVMLNNKKRKHNSLFVYLPKFTKYIDDITVLWIENTNYKKVRLYLNDGTYFEKD